jgi:hypothetical protein
MPEVDELMGDVGQPERGAERLPAAAAPDSDK